MYTTLKCSGERVTETNPSKFDERLFSDICLYRLRLNQESEIQDFVARSSKGTLQRMICQF